ncbi:hypothetical protein ACWDLG_11430 [Nonomuraea sp. NPDC003727]
MTRITVTLPSEQMAELKKLTDNVSGYVAEAVARQMPDHVDACVVTGCGSSPAEAFRESSGCPLRDVAERA